MKAFRNLAVSETFRGNGVEPTGFETSEDANRIKHDQRLRRNGRLGAISATRQSAQ